MLPILDQIRPRRVRIAFDSDWRIKLPVAKALTNASLALVRAGYTVMTETWNSEREKGIDELLCAQKRPDIHPATVALSADFRAQAQNWERLKTWRT